jgi:hypothetical protein
MNVAVRIQPNEPKPLPFLGHRRCDTSDRSRTERVIATQHEWRTPLPNRISRCVGEMRANVGDRGDVMRPTPWQRRAIGNRDVTHIFDCVAEVAQTIANVRKAQCRRTHIDAATAGAQVHRDADDSNCTHKNRI